MKSKLSYLYSISDLSPGDHICCLYDNEDQLWQPLIPFFKHALVSYHKIIYIADYASFDFFVKYFQKTDIKIADLIAQGQLTFLSYQNTYLSHASFSASYMLNFWQETIKISLDQGYSAVRIISKMDWILGNRVLIQSMLEYESLFTQFLYRYPCLAICQYDCQKFDSKVLLDVLHTHPIVLLGSEVVDNVYYIPHTEFSKQNRTNRIFRHRLRSLWEQKQIQKSLRESEERLNEAQHIAHIGSWELDLKTKHIILSSEIYRILEMPANSFDYYEIFEKVIHPQDRELVVEAYRKSFQTKNFCEIIHRIIMPDGRIKFLSQQFRTYFNQFEEPIRSIGTLQDITEYKKVEEKEHKHRLILEMIAQGKSLEYVLEKIVKLVEEENPGTFCSIFLVDKSGKYLVRGAAPSLPAFYVEESKQLEIGEQQGSCGTAAFLKKRVIVEDIEHHPFWEKYRKLALSAGLYSCWSEPIFSASGKVLGTFALYHRYPQLPTNQEIEWIETSVNFASLIIERTQAEEILQEREESYRTLAQNLPGIVYRVFLRYPPQMLFFNDMLLPMTGYSREELKDGEICALESLIFEDDLAIIRPKITWAIQNAQPFEVEYRVRHKDESIRYFFERGRSIRGKNENPSYIDGVIFDITTRRQSEESLKCLFEQTQRDAKTKSELLREINHRVKNNLISILGLLITEQRYASPLTRPFIQNTLDNISSHIKGLIEVHRLLSDSEWAPMKLDNLVNSIITGVINALPINLTIQIDVQKSNVEVSPRQSSNLALVLNELTTNTIKYGITSQHKAVITVKIEVVSNMIHLIYQDNGPGYPQEVLSLKHHNVGIHLIYELVTGSLRGKLELSNDDGAVTKLWIKTEDIHRT